MTEHHSIEAMGVQGVLDANHDRLVRETNANTFHWEVGVKKKTLKKLEDKLNRMFPGSPLDVQDAIAMFKSGEISYQTFLEYPEIVREKLDAQKKPLHYTDI